ncbi:hypothetical protein [Acidiphilium acidophilum]|uniref:Uncharacterized protein n=1 Tax=Acidiphilium acidophilum TaxID=76588 RepID=A0AAW9DTV3_ACIAO|nr:hypothetical protein [Acidiphilium acidophilum]MDX5930350.1 hypothetical protein [Acidiphilium acidophilum]MDX5932072.1 hypothetical protein [Acidiphilium acidophilum]
MFINASTLTDTNITNQTQPTHSPPQATRPKAAFETSILHQKIHHQRSKVHQNQSMKPDPNPATNQPKSTTTMPKPKPKHSNHYQPYHQALSDPAIQPAAKRHQRIPS